MATMEQVEKVITVDKNEVEEKKEVASPPKRKSEASESALESPAKKQVKVTEEGQNGADKTELKEKAEGDVEKTEEEKEGAGENGGDTGAKDAESTDTASLPNEGDKKEEAKDDTDKVTDEEVKLLESVADE